MKIGHASINELGTVKGGNTGDQTGREVCTREWYNKGWTVLLRPTTSTLAEKSAKICEKICNTPNVGYDQNKRNDLYKAWKSTKKLAGDCDCSSFMTFCAIYAGVKALNYTDNAPTTSTMRKAFTATGKYKAFTDAKYLTGTEYLQRGDILVKEGSHTVMVLENGSKAGVSSVSKKNCPYAEPTSTIRRGNVGSPVSWIQWHLTEKGFPTAIDGCFGKNTDSCVRRFQKSKGLEVDGLVGRLTRKALKS